MNSVETGAKTLLRGTLRELLQHSLKVLGETEDVPKFSAQLSPFDFEARGDGAVGPRAELTWKPNIDLPEHMRSLPVAALRDRCFEDYEIRKRMTFYACSDLGRSQRSFEPIYTVSLLTEYVKRTRTYHFDEGCFNDAYQGLEDELFADCLPLKSMLPICGVQANRALEKAVDQDTTLRRLTAEELAPCVRSLAVPFETFGTDTYYVSPVNQWAVVKEFHLPVTYFDPSDSTKEIDHPLMSLPDLRPDAHRIVQAIRLIAGGSVVSTRQVTPIPFTKLDFSGSVIADHFIRFTFPDPTNVASIPDDQVASFWQTVETLDNATHLAVAARRLADAALRTQIEDTLIDLSIALEALFAGGRTAELTEKMSLRAALIAPCLGFDPNDVRAFVRTVYRARSRIVHGSEPGSKLAGLDGEACDLAALVDDLEVFLRKVLLKGLDESALLNHENNLRCWLRHES